MIYPQLPRSLSTLVVLISKAHELDLMMCF